jgi:uncharacterized OB-fold protein
MPASISGGNGMAESPLTIYQAHLDKGELAYQWDKAAGRTVFYPRVISPHSGTTDIEWRVSKGLGTVYATTVTYPLKGDGHNIVLVDLDEGFRMMSRVEEIDPLAVKIGMRVKFRVHPTAGEQSAYPVFVPAEG